MNNSIRFYKVLKIWNGQLWIREVIACSGLEKYLLGKMFFHDTTQISTRTVSDIYNNKIRNVIEHFLSFQKSDWVCHKGTKLNMLFIRKVRRLGGSRFVDCVASDAVWCFLPSFGIQESCSFREQRLDIILCPTYSRFVRITFYWLSQVIMALIPGRVVNIFLGIIEPLGYFGKSLCALAKILSFCKSRYVEGSSSHSRPVGSPFVC